MHITAHETRAFGSGGEVRDRVEGDVDLAARPPGLEALDGGDEITGQGAALDVFEEGALDVHVRGNDRRVVGVAVLQRHTLDPAVADDELIHARADDDLPAGFLEARAHGLGDRPHAAARKAPGAYRAVDVAHVVMQQDVGCPRRVDAQPGADDARAGEVCLHQVVVEVLVEEIANGDGPEAQGFAQLPAPEVVGLADQIQQLLDIARLERGRVWRVTE